jgi:DNA-binding GntR family transcriptional regulator
MSTDESESNDSRLEPISPHTLSDQATERLRLAIQTGLLMPGTQLVERELAAQLGMSRIPVREAIRRLDEQGLLKKTTNRGAMVYLPSPEEIEDITSIRIVIERFVAELVVQRWTRDADEALGVILEQMRIKVRAKDRTGLSSMDKQFHSVTWQIAGHKVLTEVASSLRQRVTQLLFQTIALMTDEALPGVVESHERLIAVFRAGDTARAMDEMRAHIVKGRDRIMGVYQRKFQS